MPNVMSKNIFILLSFILLSFVLSSTNSLCAQCNTESYIEKSIKKIQPQGFTFVKSYPIAGKEGKKFSYVFSSGSTYVISLSNADANTKGFYVTLYDVNKKPMVVSHIEGKYYPSINFPCKMTGVYYMEFTFANNDTKDFCAAAVLGVKK